MMRRPRILSLLPMLLGASLVLASAPRVLGATAAQQCHAGRHQAAAKYEACRHQAEAKIAQAGEVGFAGDSKTYLRYKCRGKYFATWPKLFAKSFGSGSICDQLRFSDNGDGTVTDHLTGLRWEKKTDDGGIHDQDNTYQLTAGSGPFTSGSAFTVFFATVNDISVPGCFAGYCDWRLPTMFELDTIVRQTSPGGTGPLFDPTIFGPATGGFWSSTTLPDFPAYSWVLIGNGYWNYTSNDSAAHIRAVRGGL